MYLVKSVCLLFSVVRIESVIKIKIKCYEDIITIGILLIIHTKFIVTSIPVPFKVNCHVTLVFNEYHKLYILFKFHILIYVAFKSMLSAF